GIQISRNFLKEDRLQLRVGATNPIGSSRYRWSAETINGDYTGYSSSLIDGHRSFNIAISYRLGSLKSSVKKVDNGITNDDLEGRKQ
ncbi:MAG: TonB-dependent receptor, partial [Muribaculaceae bacterium]